MRGQNVQGLVSRAECLSPERVCLWVGCVHADLGTPGWWLHQEA